MFPAVYFLPICKPSSLSLSHSHAAFSLLSPPSFSPRAYGSGSGFGFCFGFGSGSGSPCILYLFCVFIPSVFEEFETYLLLLLAICMCVCTLGYEERDFSFLPQKNSPDEIIYTDDSPFRLVNANVGFMRL
jgi:hypothetical protein